MRAASVKLIQASPAGPRLVQLAPHRTGYGHLCQPSLRLALFRCGYAHLLPPVHAEPAQPPLVRLMFTSLV